MSGRRMCVIDGCDRRAHARGLCERHYMKIRTAGGLDAFPKIVEGVGNLVPLVENAGASYRQLDYWCRQGYVTLAKPAQGSGTRRVVTDEEALAIRKLAAEVANLEARWFRIRSGQFFTDALKSIPHSHDCPNRGAAA